MKNLKLISMSFLFFVVLQSPSLADTSGESTPIGGLTGGTYTR